MNNISVHHNTILCMYTDDTAILSRNNSPKGRGRSLNRHLLELEDWYSTWKIAQNVSKTEDFFFSRNNKIEPDIYLANNKPSWSWSTKYFGVT
ncbi:hypothetical protein NPIL_384621 [Nephila pilipes]|uniref:Reverse transcriptase domain-containing protein n=1 Tax=Nephila pilipes TaxID=299642 RepID=A0A8X6UJS7_NEPPI|nr:hypothetical protein NPIL_384621 [Nephila pilipes]